MIYEILKRYGARGKEKAMPMDSLVHLAGIDERAIKRQVQKERRRHFILSTTSGDGGYYRPSCRAEIRHFEKVWRGRIRQAWQGVRLARRLRRHGPQQLTLWKG